MTRLLDRLEAKGLVARTADPTDRRALNIHLTQSGLAIWQDINKCGERVRERALAGKSEEERSVLTQLLERARDNLISTASSPMAAQRRRPNCGLPFVLSATSAPMRPACCARPHGLPPGGGGTDAALLS